MHCFLIGFADRPPLVAICVVFFVFCVFDGMRMGVLIGFADRPPLVAICGSVDQLKSTDNLNSKSQQIISTVDLSR